MNRMVFPRQSFCNSFGDLATDMEHLMGELFGDVAAKAGGERTLVPRLDIAETETGFEVHVDLPGLRSEDVDIELSEDTLTITGHRETAGDEEGKNYHRRERYSGQFRRSVQLPTLVDRDGIEATFENGVLRVALPKSEKVLPTKIEIQAS